MSYDTNDYSSRRRSSSEAVDRIDGKDYRLVKVGTGGEGVFTEISDDNPVPVAIISGGGGGGIASEVSLDAATLAALETVELGATTLAALESITVVDGGGSITVDGTVAVSGTVPVSDGGGSITVDGTVAATQSGTWTARIADGSGNALTSKAPGAERALSVAIVDGSGNQVTSFGGTGGTSATDDSAFTAASGSGTPMMAFATSDAVDSGDVGVVAMTTARALHTAVQSIAAGDNNIGNVDIVTMPNVTLAAGTNTNEVVGDAAIDAAIAGNPVLVGGRASTAVPTAMSADNDAQALWLSRNGAANVIIRDLAGDSAMDETNNALRVNIVAGAGSGGTAMTDAAAFTRTSTSITPIGGIVETSAPTVTNGNATVASFTTSGAMRVAVASGGITGAVEDAVASGTAEGVLGIVVRDDALATLTPADGDYTVQRVNARGATWVALDSTVAQTVTLAAGTATNEVVGDAAHDAAIAGNPVRIAGRAMSADYTAVASGDTADILASLVGKQVTLPYALPGASWSYAAASGGITNTTAVTVKAAAGAGVRNYITSCQVINGHATVSTEVVIRDGAAGTVLHRGFAQAAGGGYTCKFEPPLRGTANTLLEVANITTGAATYVNLQGYAAAE